uniref:Protein kinase domain-containing protein n=1 Tax=Meloidogyne javanica TaxID=6303 RepID=A0A915MQ66_MELJA
MITLEYDNVEMGAGSYSKVYHATLKKRRGNSLGGKNRKQLGCIAFKKTIIPNDPITRNSVELMQMNEFEVLNLFGQSEEDNQQRFIKLHAFTRIDGPDKIPRIFYSLLEWGGGGSFRDYIFEKHNEWGCGRRKWEINDNEVFGVIKEPAIVLKELNDSEFY